MSKWDVDWTSFIAESLIKVAVEILFFGIIIGWLICHFLKIKFSQKIIKKIIYGWVIISVVLGFIGCSTKFLMPFFTEDCLVDRMGVLGSLCDLYAEEHDGRYPTYGDELNLEKCFSKDKHLSKLFPKKLIVGNTDVPYLTICPDTEVPYEWARKRYRIDDPPETMLVWDGKPHKKFFIKWRHVIFVGGIPVALPEKEFQKLLKEQQRKTDED